MADTVANALCTWSDEDFHGHPMLLAESGGLRVGVLAQGAARIVHLSLDGGNNVVAEVERASDGPFGTMQIGGHRLWRAPQSIPGADAPDMPVSVAKAESGVILTQPADAAGVGREVSITIDGSANRVTVAHTLINATADAVDWAVWAITALPLGGTVVVPLPAPAPMLDSPIPNRFITVWPQALLDDPRFVLTDDAVVMPLTAGSVTKFGFFSSHGCVSYLRDGVLLCKRFEPQPGRPHADGYSNIEIYSDAVMAEVETLSPLEHLQPGESATHVEVWEIKACDLSVADYKNLRAATIG